MKLNMSATDVDFSDPSLAYGTFVVADRVRDRSQALQLPGQARAPLGSQIQPEAAAGFPMVSKDGKTYTITVRTGLKLSATARRHRGELRLRDQPALNPTMQSPARDVHPRHRRGAGRHRRQGQKSLRRHRSRADKLIIKLTQPDGGMLAKLGMPFFQALTTNMPIEPQGVNAYPSAGPYYIASRDVGRQITLKRNTNYKGTRPRTPDSSIINVNTNLDQSLLQVKSRSGRLRHGRPPAVGSRRARAAVRRQQGPVLRQPARRDRLRRAEHVAAAVRSASTLRKAANFAIDRPAMLRQSRRLRRQAHRPDPASGHGRLPRREDLPDPGLELREGQGSGRQQVRARSASDTTTSAVGQALGQVLKFNLTQMGCNVNVKLFQGFQIYVAAGTKGEPLRRRDRRVGTRTTRIRTTSSTSC